MNRKGELIVKLFILILIAFVFVSTQLRFKKVEREIEESKIQLIDTIKRLQVDRNIQRFLLVQLQNEIHDHKKEIHYGRSKINTLSREWR